MFVRIVVCWNNYDESYLTSYKAIFEDFEVMLPSNLALKQGTHDDSLDKECWLREFLNIRKWVEIDQ